MAPPKVDEHRIRQRVAEAIGVAGGVAKASRSTGIPTGTLEKYSAQTSTASFMNAAKIAAAAGVSLDEIAFGDGALGARQDMADLRRRIERQPWLPAGSTEKADEQERLAAAIEAVESGLEGRHVAASVKAELITAAYRLLITATAENRAMVIRLVKGA